MRVGVEDPAHPSNGNHYISIGNRAVERVNSTDMMTDETSKRLILDCHTSSKERCGFILSDGSIHYIKNIHDQPHANFFLDPDEVLDFIDGLSAMGEKSVADTIVGVFHTHPNNTPWPSPRDIVGWPNPLLGFRYWIVTNYEVVEWRLTKKRDPIDTAIEFSENEEM